MTTVLVILVIAVVVVVKVTGAVMRFADRNIGFLLVLRWLAGHHHGRTNATFLHPGTRITHPSGRAGKWSHRPGYQRMAVRWGVILGTAAAVYGWFTDRLATEIVLAVLLLAGIAVSQHIAYRRVKDRLHTRGTIRPLAEAMGLQLGISPENAHRSITIRPDYATARGSEDIGIIVLPDWYAASPGQRGELEHLISSRLGVDVVFAWQTARHPMTVKISRAPVPPALIPLGDVLPVISSLPEDKVLLGLTGKGERKLWDMSGEDPHCLVSANTRRGKTRLLLLIASQVLAQGGERVTIIDPKRVGVDECLAGVPGVDVHNDPRSVEGMWDAIRSFRCFMDARIDAYQVDRTREFSRALLVIDELSQFSAMSKVYWDSVRESRDKATPPVWNDVAAILWQGAQFKCSVLVFGQRVEHGTLGGLIDSFGTRLLAGYTKRTYERLVSIPPVPVSQKQRGRFLHFDGDRPEWIQTVLGQDGELRNLAMSGKKPNRVTIAERTEAA